MDLGQGIANAGNLFSQAIMSKHEEEQRRQREALAQQNEVADRQIRMSQIERQLANDAYNSSLRTAQFAPEGAAVSPETAMSFHPQIRETFMEHLPQGLAGVINMDGSPVPQKPERYEFRAPYRKEEAVAGIRAGATTDAATIRAGSAERIAEIRSKMSEYQRLMVQVAQARTGIQRQALTDRMKQLRMVLDQRDADNLLDNQTRYDLAIIREQADDSDFSPTTIRPTGPKKPGAPKVSLDDAMSGIAAGYGK